MSKLAAAELILKRNKNRKMTFKEIIDISINEGLIETKGMTPEHTLRVDVYNENNRRKSKGLKPRFDNSETGYLKLK